MVDTVDRATRSRMMAGIKGKDTLPEMLVRRFLHCRGFRYRLHARYLPGSPDIVLPKWKVAIFVHGCFWHRHSRCRFATTPASNVERWHRKFNQNISRDQRNVAETLALGWKVIILWECGLRSEQASIESLTWLEDTIRSGKDCLFMEWPLNSDDRLAIDISHIP